MHPMPAAGRRTVKRLRPADIRDLALDYLNRFAATKRRLRIVLTRRVQASIACHGDDPEPLRRAIDETILWLEEKGYLSDRQFAEARSRALAGRGQSRRRIMANLAAKGVEPDLAKSVIDDLSEEDEGIELASARKYAKKRRLGRYRTDAKSRAAYRSRDLAAMARAGFNQDLARIALDEGDDN